MIAEEIAALLKEAREYADLGVDRGYRPFDQEARIPNWNVREWRTELSLAQIKKRNAAITAWESGHGHDCRLKCYPEFGCQAIEGYENGLIYRLMLALEEALGANVDHIGTDERNEDG